MPSRQLISALATCGATFVLALAASSVPVARTVAANIEFGDRAADTCPALLGSRVYTSESFDGSPPRDDPEMRAYHAAKREVEATAAQHAPGVGQAVRTFYGHNVGLQVDAGGSGQQTMVNLVFRDGFVDQVEPVSGPSGTGVWVPASLATDLGITVGDSLTMLPAELPSGRILAVPRPDDPDEYTEYGGDTPLPPSTLNVSAVYADIADLSDSDFWCGVPGLLRDPTLPMLLLDEAMLNDDLGFLVHNMAADESIRASNLVIDRSPSKAQPTLAEARELAVGVAAMQSEMASSIVTPGFPQTYFPALDSSPPAYESGIAEAVADAEAAADELRATVIAMLVAGLAVGVAAVSAVGVFWARRRRSALIEHAGAPMSAIALGRRAAAEAAVPVAVGALAGSLVAVGILSWMLSSIPGSALASLLASAAAMGAALVVFALSAGLASNSLALDDEFLAGKDLPTS